LNRFPYLKTGNKPDLSYFGEKNQEKIAMLKNGVKKIVTNALARYLFLTYVVEGNSDYM